MVTYDKLYGKCADHGYCLDSCGLCKFINPNQKPTYKATNQIVSYRNKMSKGTLFSPDEPGIEIGYKDPLEPVGEGFGYYGTMTIDKKTKACVQCHICGFYLKNLGNHIKEHAISPKTYKQKFGLHISKPLFSESGSRSWKHKHRHNYSPEHKKQLSEIRNKALEAQKTSYKIGKDKRPLEWYNQFGLCPIQVIDKYFKLEEELEKAPTVREYAKKYTWGASQLLAKQFGGWDEVKYQLSGVLPNNVYITNDSYSPNPIYLYMAKANYEKLTSRGIIHPSKLSPASA